MQRRQAAAVAALGTVGVLVILGISARAQAERPLVLLGGTLVDGSGAEPIQPATVVVEAGRIVAAGRSAEISIPAGAEILAVDGHTVLPGMINAHVHGGASTARLRSWAWGGVTTVRDLGTSPETLFSFRTTYRATPDQATLIAAGPLITVPGGYPIVPFGAASALPVSSRQDAVARARELLDGGVDLLKLALESGAIFGRTIPVLPLEWIRALVELAHSRGVPVSAHVSSVADLELALEGGVDDLAHMVVDRAVPPELLRRVVSQGVAWVPTLELWACTGHRQLALSNLRSFVQAGGTVALGTDYAGYSCAFDLGMPLTEIELMSETGMTPMEIIVAATANAARVCGRGDEIGLVAAGYRADLVLLDGDPLAGLEAFERVRLVMHEGVVIRDRLEHREMPRPRRGVRVEGE